MYYSLSVMMTFFVTFTFLLHIVMMLLPVRGRPLILIIWGSGEAWCKMKKKEKKKEHVQTNLRKKPKKCL